MLWLGGGRCDHGSGKERNLVVQLTGKILKKSHCWL